MKKINIGIIMIMTFFLLCSYIFATDDPPKELLRNVILQSRTNSEECDVLMILMDNKGKEWDRTGRFYTKKKDEINDMSLFYFLTPPELASSGVLTLENYSGLHDQWMYVPAYHTVRRIAGGNRGEKYMGTDFFYEDIIDLRVDEYEVKILRNDFSNDTNVVVLEVIPISEKLIKESAYSKSLWWIEPKKKVAHKVEFFDKDGMLLKVLDNSNLQLIKRYYLWGKQVMTDVQKKHKTIIEYKNRIIDEQLISEIFTLRYLKRKK